jgi:hypothetical protein
MAVGYREVRVKLQKLDARRVADTDAVMQKRLIPVIAGPGGQLYIRDGHHLALALHLAGRASMLVSIVADLSDLSIEDFWHALDERGWVHPFDGSGRRRQFSRIPSSVLGVEDDPFRSLAGALRRCGVFARSSVPYADFAWADFLRSRIDPDLQARDFAAALALACRLAASHAARHLPGWLGPNATADAAPIPACPP